MSLTKLLRDGRLGRVGEKLMTMGYSGKIGTRDPEWLHRKLVQGDRAVLASCITLVETENEGKKKVATDLLNRVMKTRISTSYRIGISGPPGAGKSTFIEVLGKILTGGKRKVAVLAVDPSSSTTGGSLLGDKTRMPELTRDPLAFIRPSPARGCLGGVTRSTNEAIVLCEAAGYEVIIVETVGVGQSEYAVSNMVDIFVLLLPPGGGDELQGVKKGIVEKADLIVVTKADGDLLPAAHRTRYEYTAALKFMRPTSPKWKPKVIQLSSKTKEGIDGFWETVTEYKDKMGESDFLAKRGEQRIVWMWTHIQEALQNMLSSDPRVQSLTKELIEKVQAGLLTPGSAADNIVALFRVDSCNQKHVSAGANKDDSFSFKAQLRNKS